MLNPCHCFPPLFCIFIGSKHLNEKTQYHIMTFGNGGKKDTAKQDTDEITDFRNYFIVH